MSPDERAIRDLVDTWMTASREGDTATVLSLMSDDVIFMQRAGNALFAGGALLLLTVMIEVLRRIVLRGS